MGPWWCVGQVFGAFASLAMDLRLVRGCCICELNLALVEVSKGVALGSYVSKKAYEANAWCYASKQVGQEGCVHW